MFTHTSNKRNKSNLSSAVQRNGKSRKSNNPYSLSSNLNIQVKLTIGQPNDKYEQEADRVADQVMRTPEDARPGGRTPDNDTVQRSCSSCMTEENALQTKPLYTQISPLIQRQPIEEEEEMMQPKLLLQRQPIENEAEELIQSKSTESQAPNSIPDYNNREGVDAFADRVLQILQPTTTIQRKCEDGEGELQMKPIIQNITPIQRMGLGQEEVLQMKAFSKQVGSDINLENNIRQDKEKGFSLPDNSRHQMEQGIGVDFSHVRIHTGSKAVKMNSQLNARAFTNGADIYFNNGQFQPENDSGQHLLAHELTHVVQQSKVEVPKIQKKDWGLLGGKGCNYSGDTEWGLIGDGNWERLNTGDCTGSFTDCDGMTCGGGFYYISNLQTGVCRTPRQDDSTFRDRRWTPTNPNRSDARSPKYRGAQSNLPPNYTYDNENPD
ncbi:MAG: DUF4157 domain-containing protein [Candidatus Scalindua sp.]|nr:DUF4157 domain-containing protein [Candidatus Scalindua sp.]